MRLGLVLPPRADSLVEVAQAAERIGFDSLWANDAFNRGSMKSEPLVALGVAAAVTDRIALGSCVVQAPLRPPFLLANQVGTVAALAGGRLTLGVGAGSVQGDFDALGVDYSDRFTLLERHVETLRALLAGREVDGAKLSPWDDLPSVPVMIGAWASASGRWLRKAAVEYDGWIASAASTELETMVDALGRFRELAPEGARAVAANLLTWRPGAEALVQQLAEAGFDETVLMLQSHDHGSLEQARAMWDPAA
jgi:alkanesulfonate monooxygenase SsuD/methylene tetrahydromethanopterin reductase-like flavin-dependent oxidoreductase (luciferase family)